MPSISKHGGNDDEYTDTPIDDNVDTSLLATFVSMDIKHPVLSLFWADEYFGELLFNTTIRVNTYPYHVWNVKTADKSTLLRTWTVRDWIDTEKQTPHIHPQIDYIYESESNPISQHTASATNDVSEEL